MPSSLALAAVVGLALAAPRPGHAAEKAASPAKGAPATCPGAELSLEAWVGVALDSQTARRAYLDRLEACVAGSAAAPRRVDALAASAIEALHAVPDGAQAPWAEFVGEVLRVNARAGYASSQHNLAAMHNAKPGSLLAKSFPQDYPRFVYWTRRAASNGEPRALFNLAVRLALDDSTGGVEPDPAAAYAALLALEPMIDRHRPQLDMLRPVVARTKQQLEAKLGEERAEELKRHASSFELSSLAPVGPEPEPRAP